MPRVSVILNCYNHERWVAEAVESVLAQSYRDFELILIDNGSTDGSRQVLERYDDPRIRRFFHDRNESLSKRLNQGVAAAKGEFTAVLYSDDMMLPGKLERQVAMFDVLPADYGVVYCPAIGFNEFTGKEWTNPSVGISGNVMPALWDRHQMGPLDMASPLFRREAAVQHPWHEDLFGDGEAIFLRIGMNWKFHFDPVPTVKLRDHLANAGKAIVQNHKMFVAMLERIGTDPFFQPSFRTPLRNLRGRCLSGDAWHFFRTGVYQGRDLRHLIARSIENRPSEILRPKTQLVALASLLPRLVRAFLNSGLDRLRPTARNRHTIETYFSDR